MSDLALLAASALRAHRLRTALSMIGIGIGIASVILMTSIGQGTRVFIASQFTSFGTNILMVAPGRSQTLGVPGVLGGTTRKLTLDDAESLARLAGVEKVIPVLAGSARVSSGERSRSVFVFGVTPDVQQIFQFQVRTGSFWDAGDPRRAAPLAVLGPTLARELFGDESPLGRLVRIAETRFRVVGLMEPKPRMLGIDFGDSAWIPVTSAMRLFNRDELMRIDLRYSRPDLRRPVVAAVRRRLTERHGGNEDFTIVTQAAMLETFDRVMGVVTSAVGAIAGISLLVGATGILTMMWIAVGERTAEIGLLRSVGATQGQVWRLFLIEAATLSTLGGIAGVAAGLTLCAVLRVAIPGLPVRTPPEFVVAGVLTSLATGLLSGVLPAQRAARLDPVEALRAE